MATKYPAQAKYHKAHPEKQRVSYTRWAKANPEKRRASYVAWTEANRERLREYRVKYRSSHQSELKVQQAAALLAVILLKTFEVSTLLRAGTVFTVVSL